VHAPLLLSGEVVRDFGCLPEGYWAGVAGQMEPGETNLKRWCNGTREAVKIYYSTVVEIAMGARESKAKARCSLGHVITASTLLFRFRIPNISRTLDVSTTPARPRLSEKCHPHRRARGRRRIHPFAVSLSDLQPGVPSRGAIPWHPLTISSSSPTMKNTSAKPARWFGVSAASRLLRCMIYGSV